MRIKKSLVVMVLICAMIIARIIYVNAAYDKPVTYHNQVGEKFRYQDSFEVTVESINKYTADEWNTKLEEWNKTEKNQTGDYIVVLTEYTIQNVSDQAAEFNSDYIYTEIGAYGSSYNWAISEKLSGSGAASSKLESGESKSMKLVYTMRSQEDSIEEMLTGKVKVQFCEYSGIHVISE